MSRSGVLVLDKPAGPTSFDVVARARRLLRAERAGHTGTLDPLATGVLAVCVEEAVKLQQYLTDGDKTYLATVAFGAATTTEDAEGEVTDRRDASALDADAVRAALPRLVGDLDQVPPMFSAVRVGGRRLHEVARAGAEVERRPRRVRVHALDLLELAPTAGGIVEARVLVRCGKGTYVRTLAVMLGRELGLPAHLSALRRTEAGAFRLDEAITLAEAERLAVGGPGALEARLVPLEGALRGWTTVELTRAEAGALATGRAVPRAAPDGRYQALDPEGRLVAVCEIRAGMLRPVRVFPRVH